MCAGRIQDETRGAGGVLVNQVRCVRALWCVPIIHSWNGALGSNKRVAVYRLPFEFVVNQLDNVHGRRKYSFFSLSLRPFAVQTNMGKRGSKSKNAHPENITE